MRDAKHESSDAVGMNKLPTVKRAKILNRMCKGQAMSAVARLEDVSFKTVAKALVDAGTVCAQMHAHTGPRAQPWGSFHPLST
jgi:hypothetical protein